MWLIVVVLIVVLAFFVVRPPAWMRPSGSREVWEIQQRLWFENRDPKTLPEYHWYFASEAYDEAMRRYGDALYTQAPSEAHWRAAREAVDEAIKLHGEARAGTVAHDLYYSGE